MKHSIFKSNDKKKHNTNNTNNIHSNNYNRAFVLNTRVLLVFYCFVPYYYYNSFPLSTILPVVHSFTIQLRPFSSIVRRHSYTFNNSAKSLNFRNNRNIVLNSSHNLQQHQQLRRFTRGIVRPFHTNSISRWYSSSHLQMCSTESSKSSNSSTTTTTTTTTTTAMNPTPPTIRRDSNSFVYAGVLPSSSSSPKSSITTTTTTTTTEETTTTNKDNDDIEVIDGPKPTLRQSESSMNLLMDPPRKIKDPYGWMRDESRTNEEVLDHLTKENQYTQAVTAHLQPLRDLLYNDMLSYIQETDYTTPCHKDGLFWYYTRTIKGKSYKLHCRAPVIRDEGATTTTPTTIDYPKITWDGLPTSPILPQEYVYLDENLIAENVSYCAVNKVSISPNQKFVAYSVDTKGDESYFLIVKNLETDEIIYSSEGYFEIQGSIVWGNDSNTIYYLTMDSAHRPYQVWRHKSVCDEEQKQSEELLYHETDDTYYTRFYKSPDDRYLFIQGSSTETSETQYIDLNDSNDTVHCVATRRVKVLYDVEHWNGYWFIATNVDGTPNKRLMYCKVGSECAEEWKDVSMTDINNRTILPFDGSYDRALDEVDTFQNHIVASGREGGIPRIWVMPLSKNKDDDLFTVHDFVQLAFDETAYDVAVSTNFNFNTSTLHVWYCSPTTPPQSLQVSLDEPNSKKSRVILKSKFIPNYNKDEYSCDRLTVTSRDGKTEIPITVVYRADVMEDHLSTGKTVPVHLYGYGAYGVCCEADFNPNHLLLMNRGIVYVCAHVRGGGEMGRQWYEEPDGGKYLCKKNTFNDFIDVANWLIKDKKLTTPQQLSCEGRSAGGLLIGASINQAPELFKVAILGVPFVDVVCTMTDPTIPLTCGEWEEWGCPNEEVFFNYMMEYCPMNNVKKDGEYPACLLTGGLHDPRVQYWEPAKLTATIRFTASKSSGPICLKIDMEAGHFSASDRYKYLSELAFDYAFLLDQLGLHQRDIN